METSNWIVPLFALLILIALGLGLSWIGGFLVFSRFYKRQVTSKGKRVFGISELIVLAIHVQLLLVLVSATVRLDHGMGIVLAVMGCCFFFMWWNSSIEMLSRASISKSSHRLVFIAFCSPIGYIGSIVLPVSTFLIPLSIALGYQPAIISVVLSFATSLPCVIFIRAFNSRICEHAIRCQLETDRNANSVPVLQEPATSIRTK